MTNYTHLSFEERTLISHHHDDGLSIRKISTKLGRPPSTVSRELQRNSNKNSYKPRTADNKYINRRQKACLLEKDDKLRKYVVERLQEGMSPEMIAIRLNKFGHLEGLVPISHESIYKWLYKPEQKKQKLHKLLVRSKANRGWRKRATRSGIKGRINITDRPAEVEGREKIGHWEADLMAFKRNSQHMLVIHERATRYTAAIKLENKTAAETLKHLMAFFEKVPGSIKKTITFDNGTEFAYHLDLAKDADLETFFCDSYASWQKGGIENMNGRLRRDLPRSTDLKALPHKDLEQIVLNHNLLPRKCLDGKSPMEALAKHMGRDIVFIFSTGVALQT